MRVAVPQSSQCPSKHRPIHALACTATFSTALTMLSRGLRKSVHLTAGAAQLPLLCSVRSAAGGAGELLASSLSQALSTAAAAGQAAPAEAAKAGNRWVGKRTDGGRKGWPGGGSGGERGDTVGRRARAISPWESSIPQCFSIVMLYACSLSPCRSVAAASILNYRAADVDASQEASHEALSAEESGDEWEAAAGLAGQGGINPYSPKVGLAGRRGGNRGGGWLCIITHALHRCLLALPLQVKYDKEYATSISNPALHSFKHVGKYFSLGTPEEVKAIFPQGLAGDIQMDMDGEEGRGAARQGGGGRTEEHVCAGASDFHFIPPCVPPVLSSPPLLPSHPPPAATHSTAMMIRPTGVALVQHMEAWRQQRGRELASGANGSAKAPVLDIDATAAYWPMDMKLELPATAALPATGASSASAGDASSALQFSKAGLGSAATAKAFQDIADPSKLPFRPLRMLTGPRGVGKSSVLNYAAFYARTNNWLTVFIPSSLTLLEQGLVLVKSKRRPGMVDQHDLALRLISETLQSAGQEERLARVPQRGTYAAYRYLPQQLDKKVTAERAQLRAAEEAEKGRLRAKAEAAGKEWDPSSFKSKVDDESDTAVDRSSFTLRDMLQWGLAHPSAATDTLLDFLQELRQVTEFPVLLAIDGLNLLYEQTAYPQDGKTLAPEQLSLMAGLQCLGPEGFKESFKMRRGMVLATVTQKHGDAMRMFNVANVRDRFRLRLPELTRQEVFSQLLHYHSSQRFLMLHERSSVDEFAVEYYRTLSSGLPRQVFNAALYQPL